MAGVENCWIDNPDIRFGKRPLNIATRSYPLIFHMNGPAKWWLRDVRGQLVA